MLKAKFNKETDYPQVAKFWEDHGWTAVPRELLPSGISVKEGSKVICAGFIYSCSETPWCFMEWIISDKHAAPMTRAKALMLLVEGLKELAQEKGKTFIYTSTTTAAAAKIYKRVGFESLEQGSETLIYKFQDLNNEILK